MVNIITQQAAKTGSNIIANHLDDSNNTSNNTEVFNPILGGDDGVVGTEDDPDLENDLTERAENNEDVEITNPILGGDDGVVGTEDDPDLENDTTDPDREKEDKKDFSHVWDNYSPNFGGLLGGNNNETIGNNEPSNDSSSESKEWKTLTIDYPREYASGGSSMFGLGVVGQPISYTINVSGEIKGGNKANTGVLGNDKASGNTASGKVSIGNTDSFKFTGNIEDISGSGNIDNLTILVDGKEYSADTSTGELVDGDTTDPSSLNSQIMLAGAGLGAIGIAALVIGN